MTQENIARLGELFPHCITEKKDGHNQSQLAVDFDLLKQTLSDVLVEGQEERYQLNWPGKRGALLTANTPIEKTLRPQRQDSVDFDTTQNLFIEGDNLEALKLLQETYLGKVKMIYIDPPYNTGNDFIYNDNYTEDTEDFLKRSNQKDEAGNRLKPNLESNGRFHSDWLSMMYPRLKLARNLLRDDGVIFISIDDNEQANLKRICDEIFGESNYYGTINWTATTKAMNSGNAKYKVQKSEEYIFIYGKISMQAHPPFNLYLKSKKVYDKVSNDGRKYRLEEIQQRKNTGIKRSEKMVFEILKIMPNHEYRWTIGEDTARKLEKSEDVILINGRPIRKIYEEDENAENFYPLWINFSDSCGTSETGKALLFSLLEKEHGFETVKPLELLIKLIFHFTNPNDFILDFFAGSATTAHAVMQLNAEDGGNRKFIMVQIPETCKPDSEAFKAGYNTIAEISKERIRRAGKKILEGACHEAWKKDIGFRVLTVDTSNMMDVYYTPEQTEQTNLRFLTDNIKPDRTDEDLLFQVLVDWGIDLSLPIESTTILNKHVFRVDKKTIMACFDKDINDDFVKALAHFSPDRVVFRDTGFASDAVKINVEQLFKQLSPSTEVRVI